jgi:SAM-dependent methyltransferase
MMRDTYSNATQIEVSHPSFELPGDDQRLDKLQGHWVLARAGKRVLRPGGRELTLRMLDALHLGFQDRVVELAPGLGATAQKTLRRNPREYWGVERDRAALRLLQEKFGGTRAQFVPGCAEQTGLPGGSATVVYSEALLSMQAHQQKDRIVAEAARLLATGGRYGIHELCLRPDNITDEKRREIYAAMSMGIHTGVQPLTQAEWRKLFEQNGLKVTWSAHAPMRLLEPGRILRDEGLLRTLQIVFRMATNATIADRVRAMRRLFNTYSAHLGAVSIIGER